MFKSNFVRPYKEDLTMGHLSTPISNSGLIRNLLMHLPIYRVGLTSIFRGLEIGVAHGYFLIGPFYKLGPLRNSEIALLGGYLSTISFILILTLALVLYGTVVYQNTKNFAKRQISAIGGEIYPEDTDFSPGPAWAKKFKPFPKRPNYSLFNSNHPNFQMFNPTSTINFFPTPPTIHGPVYIDYLNDYYVKTQKDLVNVPAYVPDYVPVIDPSFQKIFTSRYAWNRFTGGFFIGALGGSGFAFLLLNKIS